MILGIRVGDTSTPYTILEDGDDFARGHALGIETQDLVIHGGKAVLVFLHQLWLKAAFTITGCVELEFAVFGFQRFCRMAVAAISGGEPLVFLVSKKDDHPARR